MPFHPVTAALMYRGIYTIPNILAEQHPVDIPEDELEGESLFGGIAEHCREWNLMHGNSGTQMVHLDLWGPYGLTSCVAVSGRVQGASLEGSGTEPIGLCVQSVCRCILKGAQRRG